MRNGQEVEDFNLFTSPLSHPAFQKGDSMKLEPVAWIDLGATNAVLPDGGQMTSATSKKWRTFTTPLYAIPADYVVVPVSLLKRANAAMMEWAAKYGEHNPQWLPPARVAELSAEIEAMIAAKEQQ